MKKSMLTFLLISFLTGAFAQYKKVSFFEKEGRTYGLGTRLYALGDGKGSPLGYYVSFGRDRSGKRLFTWWELQYIPKYNFTKDVTDKSTNSTVTLSGKANSQLIYGYNFGWHFKPGEGDEQPMIQPYLTAGFNFGIIGGVNEIEGNSYDTDPAIPDRAFSCGIGGGTGTFYNINSWLSIKVEGGYTLQGNIAINGDTKNNYFMFTRHPYATAGVRFRIVND